ncbi:uncharacterized protein DSM5745_01896 [Aspergillus mulundensis]|uniref:Uncharacterized protein n=1 Tax=Aspergillus mulundensis TaxID=1810919 RepID=A0A3D8SVB9_9EURO|nr:Uncharacterized protein DSM5745_01896 [Aspergillus mulundensis]RDW90121.1 Uncharacterized protein DSM5745_01896 [Aspergillus mulundensis]
MQRKSQRGLSDVQARVAFLNNLSRAGSPGAGAGSTSAGGTAALQRAILGREEAESALSRVSSQLSEAQSRERRISERLESLLEELQSSKERQAHERLVFEKEIRKARKEAFRAGSALVKTQEELKHKKAEAKGLSEEVQSEREAKEKAKQEAFERAYAIAGLTEELDEVKGRLRTAEAKNQAITLQHARAREIRKLEAPRMSIAEGDLALLMTPSPRKPKRPSDALGDESAQKIADPEASNHEDTPPKKQIKLTEPASPSHQDTPSKKLIKLSDPLSPRYSQQFGESPPLTVQELVDRLQLELRWERNERINAEKDVEFMQLQCMFKICACRELENLEIEARGNKEVSAAENQPQGQIDESKGAEESSHQQQITGPSETELEEVVTRQEEFQRDTKEPDIQAHIEEQVVQREMHALETQPETEEQEPKGDIRTDSPQEDEVKAEQTQEDEIMEDEVQEEVGEPLITFSPATGTFRTIPSPLRSPQKQPQESAPQELQPSPIKFNPRLEAQYSPSATPAQKYESHPREALSESISQSEAYSRDLTPEAHPSPVATEAQPQPEYEDLHHIEHVNEIHNVKRIPLRSDNEASDPSVIAPGTPISREQALAQIRARRGRTSEMKRSVSASDAGFRAGGLNVTPARLARRIPGVQNATDPRGDGVKKNRRDMSAPIRPLR